jgi:hypothetical protein
VINISWNHQGADVAAFAPLLPKTLIAIERWAEPKGKMEADDHGPFYWVKTRDEVKAPDGGSKLRVLRPATLRLGAMKALQDAPDYHIGRHDELECVFFNVINIRQVGNVHDYGTWDTSTLDFMVQLAWFREVWFA